MIHNEAWIAGAELVKAGFDIQPRLRSNHFHYIVRDQMGVFVDEFNITDLEAFAASAAKAPNDTADRPAAW